MNICKAWPFANFNWLIVCLLICVTSTNGLGQDTLSEASNDKIIVALEDGSIIYGFFVERSSTHLTVRSTSLDIVTIPIDQILDINYLNSLNKYDEEGDTYLSTRYFVMPSSFSLKKGQSYYENILIFINTVGYGITDRLSISASTELFSVLFGSQFPLIFMNVKYSIPVVENKVAFGLNVSFLSIPADDFSSFTFMTGTATFGNRNNNFTIGIGGGFQLENGITDEVTPLTFSYMGRLSRKLSFVTENWWVFQNDLEDNVGVASAGLRVHFNSEGSGMNIGLIRPVKDFEIFAIPFVSGTVAF